MAWRSRRSASIRPAFPPDQHHFCATGVSRISAGMTDVTARLYIGVPDSLVLDTPAVSGPQLPCRNEQGQALPFFPSGPPLRSLRSVARRGRIRFSVRKECQRMIKSISLSVLAIGLTTAVSAQGAPVIDDSKLVKSVTLADLEAPVASLNHAVMEAIRMTFSSLPWTRTDKNTSWMEPPAMNSARVRA